MNLLFFVLIKFRVVIVLSSFFTTKMYGAGMGREVRFDVSGRHGVLGRSQGSARSLEKGRGQALAQGPVLTSQLFRDRDHRSPQACPQQQGLSGFLFPRFKQKPEGCLASRLNRQSSGDQGEQKQRESRVLTGPEAIGHGAIKGRAAEEVAPDGDPDCAAGAG